MDLIDYIKTYKRFFIILALVTFILSFPITISLLDQQAKQTQKPVIFQVTEAQSLFASTDCSAAYGGVKILFTWVGSGNLNSLGVYKDSFSSTPIWFNVWRSDTNNLYSLVWATDKPSYSGEGPRPYTKYVWKVVDAGVTTEGNSINTQGCGTIVNCSNFDNSFDQCKNSGCFYHSEDNKCFAGPAGPSCRAGANCYSNEVCDLNFEGKPGNWTCTTNPTFLTPTPTPLGTPSCSGIPGYNPASMGCNINYYGGDFNDDPANNFYNGFQSTLDGCQSICDGEIYCRAWTWSKNTNSCWLKGIKNPESYDSNTVSGAKPGGIGGDPTPTPTPQPTSPPPTARPTAVPTVRPTSTTAPTARPTNAPTATRVPTQAPTNTPVPGQPTSTQAPNQPTATPGQKATVFLTYELKGIGGNMAAGENPNPTKQTLPVQVALFDSQGNKLLQKDDEAKFVSIGNLGQFQSHINFENISSGLYMLKARFNNTLWKADALNIMLGSEARILLALVSGDLDQNNELNLFDYNKMLSCYGAKACDKKEEADLNIDGKVDERDLNILYAGFSKRQGD